MAMPFGTKNDPRKELQASKKRWCPWRDTQMLVRVKESKGVKEFKGVELIKGVEGVRGLSGLTSS